VKRTEIAQVPVRLAGRDPEALDRPPADQVEQLVEVVGERVQGTAKPVVVQLDRRDRERLLQRGALTPIGEAGQRPRVGEPVTDERQHDLPVRVLGQRADRAEAVDRLDQPQPLAERRHHRQRPRRTHDQVALVVHRRRLRHPNRGPFLL
jgi:hypothetical protein